MRNDRDVCAPLARTLPIGHYAPPAQTLTLLALDNCEHLVGAVSAFVSATTAHASP
jgi:hypothetical protein